MYTVLETIPLTTEAHKAAGITVWIERDQIGWHAYPTTPVLEAQYISSRFFIGNLEALKTMAIECADEAVVELTPKTPAKPKAKKTRKVKKPLCSCPVCTTQRGADGVFQCITDRCYAAYTNGQPLGSRATKGEAETLYSMYRYTSLTKHHAA